MTVDIVGTLNQPQIALSAIITGSVCGLALFTVFSLFFLIKWRFRVLYDLFGTVFCGIIYLLFTFVYTDGTAHLYTLLTFLIGFSTVYSVLKSLMRKILKPKKS